VISPVMGDGTRAYSEANARRGDAWMRMSYRRLMEVLRFLLLFVTCTLLSYGIISFLSHTFLPSNPYQVPGGEAVKVVKLIHTSEPQDWEGYLARLQLFYVTGE